MRLAPISAGPVARSCALIFTVAAILAAQSQTDPALPGSISNPDPLTVGEKFNLRVVGTFSWRGLIGPALGAGVSHARLVPREWGGGVEGYADRFGSAFGTSLSRQSMAFVLESALHEDPRYIPSNEKAFGARMKSVIVQTFMTRTDSGHRRFATSRFASAFAAGQLANAWQPASNGEVSDGAIRGVIMIGGDAAFNFMQEFFPFARPRH